jgi:uncharacterized membrane protein
MSDETPKSKRAKPANPQPPRPQTQAGASNATLWGFLIGISLLLAICVIFILIAS